MGMMFRLDDQFKGEEREAWYAEEARLFNIIQESLTENQLREIVGLVCYVDDKPEVLLMKFATSPARLGAVIDIATHQAAQLLKERWAEKEKAEVAKEPAEANSVEG